MKKTKINLLLIIMTVFCVVAAAKRPAATTVPVLTPADDKSTHEEMIVQSEKKAKEVIKSDLSGDAYELAIAQNKISFFEADFKLQVKDRESEQIHLNAKGKLWLAAERRYRVEYAEPKKQILVSNGRKRWLYLQEINQVQIQAMPPEGNPAEFFLELGGGLNRLLEKCDVQLERKMEDFVYTLIPKTRPGADFEKTVIWTKGENRTPYKMVVNSEKIIQVDFEKIMIRTDKSGVCTKEDELFEFVAPKNAEIIEMLWMMK